MGGYAISASQLKLFARCPRRWRYSLDSKPAPTPALRFGHEVHTCIEAYLKGAAVDAGTKAGAVVAQAQKLLDELRNGSGLIEVPFRASVGDITFHGRADFIGTDFVLDFKTTRSKGGIEWPYALTEEGLKLDEQAILYSWAFNVPEARWAYLCKNRKGYKVVTTSEIAPVESLLPNAAAMVELRRAPAACTQTNENDCFSFGRTCPYKNICNVRHSPIQRREFDMDLQSMLNKAREKAKERTGHIAANPTDLPTKKVPRYPDSVPEARPETILPPASKEAEDTPIPFAPTVPSTRGPNTLYIGCVPTTDYIDAWEVVLAAIERVQEATGSYYKSIEYGQGTGLLAVELASILKEHSGKAIVIRDLSCGPVSDSMHAFMAWSDVQVRGV